MTERVPVLFWNAPGKLVPALTFPVTLITPVELLESPLQLPVIFITPVELFLIPTVEEFPPEIILEFPVTFNVPVPKLSKAILVD